MRIFHVFVVGYAAIACVSAAVAAMQAPAGAAPAAGAAQVGPEGLPIAAGRDTVLRVCTSCHTTDVILEKRLSFADWDSLVQGMVSRGATATDQEVQQITDYLAASFPAG